MPEHSPCYHSQELLVAIDTFDIFIWVTTQQNISSATFVVGFVFKGARFVIYKNGLKIKYYCTALYLILS